MCGKWLAGLVVYQLFCITMVSTDKHLSVYFFDCLYGSSYTLIYSFYSFDCSIFHTGMSYHIRICEVDDDHVIFVRLDCIYQFVTYFVCTHLRFQIISSNFRGFNKDSVLSFVRFFNTTVEEESYMSIFFSLGDTCLSHIMSCKIFTKCILNLLFVESYDLVRNRLIVIGKAYISQIQSLFSFKSFESIVTECSCDFTGTVRTEVKEYDRVFILNGCYRFAVFFNNSRKYKFVCLVIIIRCLNSLSCISTFYADTFCQSIICQLYTIPAVISVHCIVTTGNNTDLAHSDFFHLCLQGFDKALSGSRRCITSVQEAMHINFFQSFFFSQFQQTIQMSVMAVNTTIRKKSHKMKG